MTSRAQLGLSNQTANSTSTFPILHQRPCWQGRAERIPSPVAMSSIRNQSQGCPGTCPATLRREHCPPPGQRPDPRLQRRRSRRGQIHASRIAGPPIGPPTATARRLLGSHAPGAAAPPRPEGSARTEEVWTLTRTHLRPSEARARPSKASQPARSGPGDGAPYYSGSPTLDNETSSRCPSPSL